MPKVRLTRTSVDKLEFTGKQVEYFDTKVTGFAVRVNQTGKTYFVHHRVKNRKNSKGEPLLIRESIGRTDVIDYDRALEKAKAIIEDAAHGITPADKRAQIANLEADKIRKAEQERKKDITLQEAFKEYVKTRRRLKSTTVDLYQYDIDLYVPDWKDVPLRSITGDMIVARHSDLGKRSKARADGVMRVLRAVFNFATQMYEDVISKNPVNKLSSLDTWYNVGRKESYVRPRDLKKFVPAVLNLGYDTTRDFILMMLFQGSRKEETATLRWKDINLVDGTGVFRETKTGVSLEVPFSRYILAMLEERQKYYYDGPDSYVFPSYGKSGHIIDVRSALDQIRVASGVKSTHHDLRRSFISYCEELEITLFSRKRLVNHAIPLDVTEGYTIFNMARLREHIEQVAEFILNHAGMSYQRPGAGPLTKEQAGAIMGTEFWERLSAEQKEAFLEMLGPKESGKVVSLEAAKIRRRMGVR